MTKMDPNEVNQLDQLLRKHTAFKDTESLLSAAGGYRPSICVGSAGANEPVLEREERTRIADLYDKFMEMRGDDRRAFRYGAGK